MIDLHTHTTASDGLLSPARLMETAAGAGVRVISVTDHDTLSGLVEAKNAAAGYAMEFIAGVELSSEVAREDVHILGYFINFRSQSLTLALNRLRDDRKKRVGKILERLEELGVNPGKELVRSFSNGESIGRPHIARAMKTRGFVKENQEAFDKYLKRGRPAYIPREKLAPREAVRLILEADGLPVLAHPGYLKDFTGILHGLLEAGLQGIEAYYPAHNPEQTDFFVRTAEKNHLIITAGSDFHGADTRGMATPGMPGVPRKIIEGIKDLIRTRKDGI